MRFIKNISVYLFLSLFWLGCSKTEDSPEVEQQNAVKKILEEYKSKFQKGGLVLSYQQKGKELKTVAVGYADEEKKQALTKDMYFAAASNTKTFVAALIMLLKEKNKLKLSDPIDKYITKTYANINPKIKISELLNHSSGLSDFVSLGLLTKILTNPSKKYTKEEILNLVPAPKKYAPGTDFAYSSTNYFLLGMIIEKVSGKKYEPFLKEQIINKIPLKNTFFEGEAQIKGKMANSYLLLKGQKPTAVGDMDRTGVASVGWAVGDLVMQPQDMVHFYRALFQGKVVSEESLKEMKTTKGSGELLYGYGLQKRQKDGFSFYGHGGKTVAFESLTAYEPKSETIICVYANSGPYENNHLQEIAKKVFLSISK